MIGNFEYYNPTKLFFGEESLNFLKDELMNYGPVVLLNYGGGSVKRNGIYDQVVAILSEAGKTVVENPGVMSNPTLEKLREGIRIARDNKVDFILSLGGGSVCDYSKGVAAAVYYDGDPWQKFYLNQEDPAPDQKIIPIGCILTMAGTGSEMNGGSVITDAENTFKVGHVFDSRLMRGLIVAARKAVENPEDYEARSNIMWTATWALNTLIGKGKTQDWIVHMIGHSIGAWTHAPHGYTLASVSIPYYKFVMPNGLPKFVRFARNVWGISSAGKTDGQIAAEGLEALRGWMEEIGLPLTITELGATEQMLDGIVNGTVLYKAGYGDLTPADVKRILQESM